MKKWAGITLCTLGVIVFLSGCSLIPDYTRPEAPVPPEWPRGEAYRNAVGPAGAPVVPGLRWQDFFTDARLQKLIGIALENNRDLRLAALNVAKTQAMYGVERAELLPAAGVSANGGKQHQPDIYGFGRGLTLEQYQVNFGISAWEIDFFGRIRSLAEQALQEYLATREARRSCQISLISEVARTWLTLAADRQNLAIARSTLKTQQDVYNLIRHRYDTHIANLLDLSRAQTQVDSARRDVARYEQFAASDRNALNLLAGSIVPPDLLPPELEKVKPVRAISARIPSEVLLQRPDILEAEYRLKGAYAYIGAARAAFFPRISLTAVTGTASDELSGLFSAGSHSWTYGSQIALPVLDPRIWAAYRVSRAERRIALTAYEKAIQTAFREVADTLAVRGTIDRRVSAQESLVNALEKTYGLAGKRYEAGIDSYLGVLDAQRSLFAARQELVMLRLARLTSLIRLYAVLGGGGGLDDSDHKSGSGNERNATAKGGGGIS